MGLLPEEVSEEVEGAVEAAQEAVETVREIPAYEPIDTSALNAARLRLAKLEAMLSRVEEDDEDDMLLLSA